MAGRGSRFKDVSNENPEYKKPKPFINVKNRPMVRWATASLPFLEHPGESVNHPLKITPKDLIFIILQEHNDSYNVSEKLKELYGPDIKVIILPEVTRGAAETAYMAKPFVDANEDVIISDSDHFFDGSFLTKAIENKPDKTMGIIPVFNARNEGVAKWSYSLTKQGSNVAIKVAEKDPELMNAGAYANIGAYYFTKAGLLFELIEEVIRNNELFGPAGKGEFYVAPLYQKLLDRGHEVLVAVTPEVWGLGTPSDLEYFLQNYNSSR